MPALCTLSTHRQASKINSLSQRTSCANPRSYEMSDWNGLTPSGHCLYLFFTILNIWYVLHLQEVDIWCAPGQFVHVAHSFRQLCSPLLQMCLDALCLTEGLSLLLFQQLRRSISGLFYHGLQPGKLLFNNNTNLLHWRLKGQRGKRKMEQ